MKAIIAVNNLGFIGLNGGLPWRCSDDLKHFKRLTINCNLLVGFRTFSSLPPLKDRKLILDGSSEINDVIDWCIGGKKTYEKYCHEFTELHISHIDDDTIGDTMLPNLSLLNPDCKIFHYYFKPNQ